MTRAVGKEPLGIGWFGAWPRNSASTARTRIDNPAPCEDTRI
jgi:hypothetical protein